MGWFQNMFQQRPHIAEIVSAMKNLAHDISNR